MRRESHAGFGGRARETDLEQPRHRARVRPDNLAEHVQRAVTRHHGCLKKAVSSTPSDPPPDAGDPAPPTPPAADQAAAEPETGLVTRIRERYATVQALQADGRGLREIARQLQLDRKTVRRFAQAHSADDLIARTVDRDTLLDTHRPYLHQRWTEGCRDVTVLHAELAQRGYPGSVRTLYRYLQPLRAQDPSQTPAPVGPEPPKIRHVTSWLLRRPEDLDSTEQTTLADIRGVCPDLDRLGEHITAFAKMMVHRTGAETLDTWLAAVETDTIPELHTFARGIRQDYDAVRNGLSLPYSSGACEGNVNRVKYLKRQMFGRANTDLLRKRILIQP